MEMGFILACAKNGIIGKNNDLPWHLNEDLKRFKAHTVGKTVIMGRKTWEALNKKGLPKRLNVVVSRQPKPEDAAPDLLWIADLEIWLKQHPNPVDLFLIGGAQLLEQHLHLCKYGYLTLVDAFPEGDTVFNLSKLTSNPDWDLVEQEPWPADEKNDYPQSFQTWKKRG